MTEIPPLGKDGSYPTGGGDPQPGAYPPPGGYAQQPGYPQQPGHPQQPGYPQPGYPYAYPAAPDNYLVWGILTTILCCLPLGVVSLIQSSRVNKLWAEGRFDEAHRAAQSAKTWAIWSAAAAVLWIAVIVVYLLMGIGFAVSNQ